MNIVDGLGAQEETTKRLLKNPGDIAQIYDLFYGRDVQSKIDELLTDHLKIGAKLINAMKENDKIKSNDLDKQWHKNADDIANALVNINSFYDLNILKNMFYTHLYLTKLEVIQRINKSYTEDVTNFDKVGQEATMMTDYLVDGIYRQFINNFI